MTEKENHPDQRQDKKKWPLAAIALLGLLILGAIIGLLLYQELQYPGDYQPSRRSVLSPDNENESQSPVRWQAPRQISNLDIFKPSDLSTRTESLYYKVGEITTGKYQNADMVLAAAGCSGICLYEDYYRLIADEDQIVILEKYSSEIQTEEFKGHVLFDSDFTIPELDYPDELTGDDYTLKLVGYVNEFFDYNGKYMIFEHDKYGPVYTDGPSWDRHEAAHGFYFPAPDGTVRVYELVINFMDENQVPQIIWNTGEKNKDKYIIKGETGCNLSLANRQYDPIKQVLEPIGTTTGGEIVFGYKEKGQDYLRGFYQDRYNPYDPDEKMFYTEFLDNRPVFFWVDPYNRLLEFTNDKFLFEPQCVI